MKRLHRQDEEGEHDDGPGEHQHAMVTKLLKKVVKPAIVPACCNRGHAAWKPCSASLPGQADVRSETAVGGKSIPMSKTN